jgi:TonB family protein
MRLTLFLLLTSAALAVAPAPPVFAQDAAQQPSAYGAPSAAWARYTYPGEEFSVEMPGMPFVMHRARGVGSFAARGEKMRVFGRYAGGVVFFVVAYDKPRSSESFDAFAAHYLHGGWGVAPKGSVTLGGFEGRSYSVVARPRGSFSYELHGEGRVFITKKHAYLALAFSPEAGRPEVARFLDSLTLGPSPQGERVAESAPVERLPQPGQPPQPAQVPPGVLTGPDDDGDDARRLALTRDPNARRAIIVYRPEPDYTEEARRARVTGTVRLRVVLGAEGEVKDISVMKGLSKGLTEKAIEAARHMLFFPAVKDGRPVSQRVVVEHNFNIY